MKALENLETLLHYNFKDRLILESALTHKSALSEKDPHKISYQRLEFLGDRVLGLIVVELLLKHFPDAHEGELAKRLNHLVKADFCADIARDLGLGRFVILGDGELKSGGRKKKTILADICESIIGALYVDGGYQVARDFIEKYWYERLTHFDGPLRDAKTMLQEWAHSQQLEPPVYELLEQKGPDHAPCFLMQVRVEPLVPVRAEGSSKRIAEQACATALLERENVWSKQGNEPHE